MTNRSFVHWMILLLSAAWIVGCLLCFFSTEIAGTDHPEWNTRWKLWGQIQASSAVLLNPLDFDFIQTDARSSDCGWRFFPQRFPFVAAAGILCGAAWIMGFWATRRLTTGSRLTGQEVFIVRCGAGLSLLSLWILFCGRFGELSRVCILLPAVAAVCHLVFRRYHDNCVHPDQPVSPAAISPVSESDSPAASVRWICLLIIAAFSLNLIVGAMSPPRDFDVREYHLQGPKEWFQAGGIQFLEHNVYTSFPFLTEMLSLGGMVLLDDWWDGALAGKLTLAMFQLLTTLTVFAIARRWVGSGAAWISATVYIAIPWTTRISLIAYAEGALTFYLVAAIMSALVAASGEQAGRKRLIILTGFLSGSAMAAKYPGVLSVVIPVGLYLVLSTWRRSGQSVESRASRVRDLLQTGAVYSAAVLAAVSPWLIKNLIDTGNPVYPLMSSVFGGVDLGPDFSARWGPAHSPGNYEILRIPSDLAGIFFTSTWTSPLLCALVMPSLLLVRRQYGVRWIWGSVIWMIVSWWILTHRIDRFWIPILPAMAVLAGSVWTLSRRAAWRTFVLTAVIVCSHYQFGFCRLPLIGFHAGLLDISKARTEAVRYDIRVLNKTLPASARVLMVGEAEVFDCDFDLAYNTVFDDSLFERWTSSGRTALAVSEKTLKPPGEILETLARHRITHILVNWGEILRYREPGSYGYTNFVNPQRFLELQRLGVIESPIQMLSGNWPSEDPGKQKELNSWPGIELLRNGDGTWVIVQMYRVTQPSSE